MGEVVLYCQSIAASVSGSSVPRLRQADIARWARSSSMFASFPMATEPPVCQSSWHSQSQSARPAHSCTCNRHPLFAIRSTARRRRELSAACRLLHAHLSPQPARVAASSRLRTRSAGSRSAGPMIRHHVHPAVAIPIQQSKRSCQLLTTPVRSGDFGILQ